MPLEEMWCTNLECRHNTRYVLVSWSNDDITGPAEPATDSCPKCGSYLVTEHYRVFPPEIEEDEA